MKKILFANNYDMLQSRNLYLSGKSPSQHLFGINELLETKKYSVDYILVYPKNYKNRIIKLLSLIPKWINLYFKAKKYDIVYGGADFTIDFLGIMKKIGLFKPLLITIFHHPPFTSRIRYTKYDHIIFLSEFAYYKMCSIFPSKAFAMHFLQWGPDISFYQKYAPTSNFLLTHDNITFISNGKTKRDHELLIDAAESIKARTIIVSDQYNVPGNYSKRKCKYVTIFEQEKPNDINMVKLLAQCSVLIIPTPPTKNKLGPIGLTSFLDAIAMGIPIIAADNTILNNIIINNKIGFVYQAGNLSSLKNVMNNFILSPDIINTYGKNAYNFGLKNDIKKFGEKLNEIMLSEK